MANATGKKVEAMVLRRPSTRRLFSPTIVQTKAVRLVSVSSILKGASRRPLARLVSTAVLATAVTSLLSEVASMTCKVPGPSPPDSLPI